jgi:hypothetical protein
MGKRFNAFIANFILLLSLILPSFLLAQIDNQSQWDQAFASVYYDTEPMLKIADANEGGRLAWQASYWLRAYVSMAQTFGDTKYLDRTVRLIDFLLTNRDDARFARGELDLQKEPYYTAPTFYLNNRDQAAPGWRHWDDYYKGWRVFLVDDAMITSAIMRFVDLVFEEDSFATYREKANEYIKKVAVTVRAHDDSFIFNRFENIPGSYYYPNPDGSGLYSGAVEFNMNATMGVTLLLLDKVHSGFDAYRQKAGAILDYFKLHARVTGNGAYDWDYHPQSPSVGTTISGKEDFNHAHLDLGFFNLAHKRGLALSKTEMQRFANTLRKNIYLGNGELSWSVDGKERNVNKNYWPVAFDWLDLAAFDAQVLAIAREVYEKHYPKPAWARSFLGWAEILRWTKILAEKDFTSPKPPENVRSQQTIKLPI